MRIYGLEFVFNENGIFAKPKISNNIMIPALKNNDIYQKYFFEFIELKKKVLLNPSMYIVEYTNHCRKFNKKLTSILEDQNFVYDIENDTLVRDFEISDRNSYILYLECQDNEFSRKDKDFCNFFISSKYSNNVKILKFTEKFGKDGLRTKCLLLQVYPAIISAIKIGCCSVTKFEENINSKFCNLNVYSIYQSSVIELNTNEFGSFEKDKVLIET